MRSPRHEEALRYAADGIPVFPCRVNGKEPATEHGYKDATTNPEQINEWWNQADYNLALCPEDAGWAVIDIDGRSGLENWKNLSGQLGSTKTCRVRTPRGGEHHYYSGSCAASTGKIAAHIDTRGRGSYVLVPPSVIDGVEYQWANDLPTADLPEWIPAKLAQSAQAITEAAVDELDLPANIARAEARLRDLVAQGDIAIEGQGGDDRTYRLATEMLELGLSPETTLDLMDKLWNTHCLPPWDRDELGVKIENASRYAQNTAGAFAVGTAQEAFGSAIEKLKAETSKQSTPPRFYAYSEDEQDKMPEPTWLLPDLLPDNSVVMFYGPTESYKSFLALDIALGLAYGAPTFGAIVGPKEVVYVAGEGPRSITRHRRPAWKIAREVSGSGKFYLVKNMPLIAAPEMFPELADQIRAQGLHPKLIVIDTAARAMAGLSENDVKDVSSFLAGCDMLKEVFGCTVLFIHHMSDKKGASDYRGSSALGAGVDASARVTAWKATKAVTVQIEKMKDAEARPDPWTFEGRMIGRSLVFFPTSPSAHAQLTRSEDVLDRRKIGAALTKLGAIGREKAVLSPVLAAELLSRENQTAEERQAGIGRLCRALGSLSKTTLLAYCERDGRDVFWFIPAM